MSFDFSTLVTDRTQADVSRVKQIAEKIKNGTASESELAEFNSAAMKGAYNHTDLNRVTAAMEALKAKLEGYGYSVPGYQRIKVPHVLPEPEPTSRLPEGYTELTYIESTGTQYIDTEIAFSSANYNKIKFSVEMDSANVSGAYEVNGTGTTNQNCFYIGNYNGTVAYGDGKSDKTTGKSHHTGRCKYTIDAKNGIVSADGMSDVSFTPQSPTVSASLYVCGFGRTNGTATGVSGKFYAAQIWVDDVLARDFIPCINPDGSVGLYDLVTAAFFGNSGTGSFVAGAIPRELPEGYTQVEYIQSSGTQYIDTGFKPNQDTRIVADIELISPPSNYPVPFGVQSSSSTQFWVYVNSASVVTANWQALFGSKETSSSATGSGRQTIDFSQSGFSADAVTVAIPAQTFQCNHSLWLCGHNSSGTARFLTKVKYYSCQIYDNGTLARDLVPCKNSSGVVGLYDMVNGVFYQNAGSGEFTAGYEVASPVTAAVAVVSNDLTEYDPYTWHEFDWPTPETMTIYLLNVAAIRSVLAVLQSTPNAPSDMGRLMAQEANNIEVILLDVCRQLSIMPTTFIPCGEALCGGDNL